MLLFNSPSVVSGDEIEFNEKLSIMNNGVSREHGNLHNSVDNELARNDNEIMMSFPMLNSSALLPSR